jgi:hypothetical protein
MGVFLYACFEEKGGVMSHRLDADLRLDRVCVFPKLVLRSHPADMELSIIERTQSPCFKRPANMSTHGKTMDAMHSRRLLNAQKPKSSGILKHQANHLSE